MARSIYSNSLKNRTNRLKLPIRKKPVKTQIAPGIFLCYRRNAGPGTWSVEATGKMAVEKTGKMEQTSWMKRFGLADDHEDANNTSVFSFYQAQAYALKMVRGSADTTQPITVDGALTMYQTDLEVRDGAIYNATSVRNHMAPSMLSKVVALLDETELVAWRNGLVTKGLKVSSANRIGKSLKACLALAAKRDKRITNASAWKSGLKPLKVKGGNAPPRDNYYLPDATILNIVAACHAEDSEFGALIETLATTGTRESQALKLYSADIRDDDPADIHLMLWCSNKGKDRDPEQRPVSITPRLAKLLRDRAQKRGAKKPLFDRIWNVALHFRRVLEQLDLDLTLTPYTLRHSSIIRQIKAGKALRMIAYAHDTSVVEIEKTYARYLGNVQRDQKGLLDTTPTTPGGNVIQLVS